MIDRYTCPEMKIIWELKTKFEYFLKVELAVCDGYVKLGKFPENDIKKVHQKADFSLEKIEKIEKEVHHDVIAFLTNVNQTLGKRLAQYIHVGLTSSDVIDTAFSLQLQDSSKIINTDFENLLNTMKNLAIKHKHTVCIGRSHGIHAEITTFGVKLLNMYDTLERVYKNFIDATEAIRIGKISGAIGTYSNLPIELEPIVCESLNLKPARISTQIIPRDYHAKYMQSLGLIATVIEQIATEIRHLQRTEVREAEEGFTNKQKGSSAMPHKKNPILSENLCGLARVVRNNVNTAMENIVLWHERDISHSSAERIIFPDSLILTDFMLKRLNNIFTNLVVKEENMFKNTTAFGGLVYSQKVMLELIENGLTREEAYKIVQRNALDAFENNGSFRYNLEHDDDILSILSTDDLDDCFQQKFYLRNIDDIFKKFGI